MNEIKYLKNINIPPLSFESHKIGEMYDGNRNLWDLFCNITNRYTSWDGIDHKSKMIDILLNSTSAGNGTRYLHNIVTRCPNTNREQGRLFGIVNRISDQYDHHGIWEAGWDDEPEIYSGNGLDIAKHLIMSRTHLNSLCLEIYPIDPHVVPKTVRAVR